jgi:uncharacterized lipoprotein YehR (DUF1307 family)
MKKWIMFCLTLLISITLVACNSDNSNNSKDAENADETPKNTEDVDNAENEDETPESTEEEIDTDVEGNEDSQQFDIDPTGENIVTLETEQNGIIMKLTYKANGDKVFEQTANNVMPYESLGVTTAEEAEAILAELVAGYQEAEGVTHNMDYQDDQVIESLTIDYAIADVDIVSQLSGSSFEGDLSQGISLQRSIDLLLQQGFEIVE